MCLLKIIGTYGNQLFSAHDMCRASIYKISLAEMAGSEGDLRTADYEGFGLLTRVLKSANGYKRTFRPHAIKVRFLRRLTYDSADQYSRGDAPEGSLVRSAERYGQDARCSIGTPGFGRWSFVRHSYRDIPPGARPEAKIVFVPTSPGNEAIVQWIRFRGKC